MEPFADGEVVRVTLDGWFVRLKWVEGVSITQESAEGAMAEVNRICGSASYPMLVDMRGTHSVTRSARSVFTLPCAVDTIALLGGSPVDRVVANFVLGVSKMPTPTKFFNSESAAVAWLQEMRDAPPG